MWDVSTDGSGPNVAATRDGVVLTLPAHAVPRPPETVVYARLASYCSLAGPFDIQLRYELRDWPRANGATLQLSAAFADVMRVSDPSGSERYAGVSNPAGIGPARWRAEAATGDRRGVLRVVRQGATVSEYVRRHRKWQLLLRAPVFDAQVYVLLQLSSTESRFSHRQVSVLLRDFRVNRGSFGCAQA